MKNKKIIIFIIFILIISLCYIKNILFSQNSYENFSYDNTVIIENTEKENVKDEFIKIHIYGEVVKQGILELPVDSRVYDAIELSGGTTENADISKINLAYILSLSFLELHPHKFIVIIVAIIKDKKFLLMFLFNIKNTFPFA